MKKFTEESLEKAVIEKLEEVDYIHLTDNNSWVKQRRLDDFLMEDLLKEKLLLINKGVNEVIIDEAIKQIKNLESLSLFERNKRFHNYLADGIKLKDDDADVNPTVKLIDYNIADNNSFNVVNQVKFKEHNSTRIPDVIIYINGMPLIVFELKSIEDREDTYIENAYEQLGRDGENSGYRYDIPTLFDYNAFLVISDGANSKIGTLTSSLDRYSEWKSKEGETPYKNHSAFKLDYLIEGVFKKERLLDIIKNNLFFVEKDKSKPIKILSQYHQYFGVNKAYISIKKALKPKGNGKAGVVWHTQGSGKSFSMLMLAHKLKKNYEKFNNPTIVVLTDRNDLDDQLFSTFSSATEYLREAPIKATSRVDLLDKLATRKTGGIIFATLQKFDKDNIIPNTRNNVIVISDEAHRSQYGLEEKIAYKKSKSGDLELISKYGYGKYVRDALPNATFIGYTGTPIQSTDKDTYAVFGELIDVYDMTQAVEDNATVKIFYEPRLAKVWLDEDKLKEVDKYYSELEADGTSKEALKKSQSTMSRMEVLVGDEDRLNLLANDILNHYNERKSILNSKAMIVCMTRRTAYDLYNQIIEVQPDIKEKVAVIVTESNKDTKEQRDIFKDKSYREWARNEFKKKNSKIKLVIVVNMLLTGYDVEDLDVMYIDKPMKSHNLMQAIARVNRVYKGKENGLVVDYIGLRKELNNALNYYTKRDKEMNIQNIQDSAKMLLKEKLSVLNEMFYKINYKNYLSSDNLKRFQAIQNGADFIFASKKRQKDFMKLAKDLKNAYIVSMTCLEDELKNKTLYYISIRHFTMKLLRSSNPVSVAEINNRVAELISESIKGDETELLIPVSTDDSNIFDLLKDDIIEKLRNSKPPHIFIKIMEKLLKEAVSEYKQYNLIKAKKYSERLKDLLDRYLSREDNDVIDNTIDELVGFSKEMVEDENEAKTNKISGRERAFYDALIVENDVEKLKNDGMLRVIAFELKKITEKFAVVDWSKKRSTQAKMRMAIRKLLKKHNYPPNYTDSAIDRILNQAEYMM